MEMPALTPHNSASSQPTATARKIRLHYRLWWLALLIPFYFAQLYWEVGGVTLRTMDIVTVGLLGILLLPAITNQTIRYRHSYLNAPLLAWAGVVVLGMVVTTLQPFSPTIVRDAWVTGVRIVLAIGTFFLFSHYPAPAEQKAKWVFAGIIVFSFVTTLVSFWQIAYWDLGRNLPIPALLRDLKPDANSEQGREIFGLFIGDTITHTWAAMLAMQVLTVFVFATNQRHQFLRWAGWGYAGILTAIIFRTSVRNSMVGVLVSVVIYLFMRGWRNRLALNRVFKPLVIILAGVIGLLLISAIETDSYAIVRLQQALPQFGGGQITISRASNILGRLESWEAAGRIYATHPILGAGWGSFEALAIDFGADKARPHAHNSFVQTAADFGTVGLLLLAWLMWRISRYLYVTAGRVRQNKWWRMSWELTICMFIFFLFTAFFAHPFGSPRELGIRMVLLGVLVSFSSETRP